MVIVAGLVIAVMLVRRWIRAPSDDRVDDVDASPLSASQRRAVQRAVARLREEEPA
jgi:hypothetical protein